jgi:hypothetical protein
MCDVRVFAITAGTFTACGVRGTWCTPQTHVKLYYQSVGAVVLLGRCLPIDTGNTGPVGWNTAIRPSFVVVCLASQRCFLSLDHIFYSMLIRILV